MDEDRTTAGRARRRPPKPVTPDYLRKVALWYLERYAASAAGLRRVLARRVRRAAEAHGTDPAEAARWVEELIARFRAAGLLDDGLYAEGRARSLAGRGVSGRRIRQKLVEKGVDEATAARAASRAVEEDGGELAAAARYARRRRIGPFRDADLRANMRQRDLAALARQGFPPDIALRVVDAADPEALEEG